MGKKRKPPKRMLTLEEQLDAMGPRPTWPEMPEPWMGPHVQPLIASMVWWDARRAELQRAISARDAKKLRDPGRDASGNFDVSPFLARGHKVEVAPKELRSSPDSQFPKRRADERVIDWYRSRGHISEREWKAANELWTQWCDAERNAKVTSGYEPVIMSTSANMDGRIAKKLDAAIAFVELMKLVPYRSQGVVRAVVIEDWTASDWAKLRGKGSRDSKAYGLDRLRPGLQALADFMGY